MVCSRSAWLPLECLAAQGGPSGSSADLESLDLEEHGYRNLRSSLSLPSSMIWQHLPLLLLNHISLIFPLSSLTSHPYPTSTARTMGFITIEPNFIFFLAPWLLAHSSRTLKMFWCANEWVGNAVQASHQTDILYLQALHFARVPLRNLTRLERVEEKGGHSRATHSCQHIFNAHNLKEHGLCVLGSCVFLIPQFLVPIV